MKDEIVKMLSSIQDQAPEVARQLTAMGVLTGIVGTLFGVLMFSLCCYVFFRKYEDEDTKMIIRIILSVLMVCILIATFCSLEEGLKALLYPKGYLAEILLRKL